MVAVQSRRQHTGTSPARPAEPLLASSLAGSLSLDAFLEGLLDVSSASASAPASADPSATATQILRTRTASLDDALGDLLQSGRAVALSGETSSLRDDLAQTLLVDCLVRDPEGLGAVVDTAGNFDVVGLYARILTRLGGEDAGSVGVGRRVGSDETETREEFAAKALDRVKIMRVFDFIGVKEAVDELRDELEGRVVVAGGDRENVSTPVDVIDKEQKMTPKKRVEVADSEDEEESLEASDDEMLFDTEAHGAGQDPPPAVKHEEATLPQDMNTGPYNPSISRSSPKLKLILIDNLAHVLTPLLKKDTLSANTLAATFLTTLSHLTSTHALHTILLNPCTTPRTTSPTRQPLSHITPHQQPAHAPQQSYIPQHPPPPSIFSSNTVVPALLGLLGRYADAHVLVTQMPRRKLDAKVFYAETGEREKGKRKGVDMVGVLEVVADRWGDRVSAWGVFGKKM